MNIYELKKANLENMIEYRTEEIQKLDAEIFDSKKEFEKFEKSYIKVGENLANKIEKIVNQEIYVKIPCGFGGGIIGSGIGTEIKYMMGYTNDMNITIHNMHLTDLFCSGEFIGLMLGGICGIVIANKIIQHNAKKLLKENPDYTESIIDYSHKLNEDIPLFDVFRKYRKSKD